MAHPSLILIPSQRTLLLLLVVATLLNILIAGSAALWSPLPKPVSAMMLTAYNSTGLETIVGFTNDRAPFADVAARAPGWLSLPPTLGNEAISTLRASAGAAFTVSEHTYAGTTHTLARTGWPFCAFECEGVYDPTLPSIARRIVNYPPNWPATGTPRASAAPPAATIQITWTGGIDCPALLRPAQGMRPDTPRPLPFRPVITGFIANTLIFAAALWPNITLAHLLRSRLRRRRNLCPHCAYSLLNLPPNSPCPECGAPHSGHTALSDPFMS